MRRPLRYPVTPYARTAIPTVFTDSVPDDYATEVLLVHTKRVDTPSCLHKAPVLSAALSSWMTPRSPHFCNTLANLRDVSVELSRPTGYGTVAVIYSVWMYILPNETNQCDVISCLAETDECAFNHSPQLAPGNLIRLDRPPALKNSNMVDTISRTSPPPPRTSTPTRSQPTKVNFSPLEHCPPSPFVG